MVILPETDLKGACSVTETLQAKINKAKIPHTASDISDQVTISLGVSSIYPDHDTEPAILIACADQALYHAKTGGRNRCG